MKVSKAPIILALDTSDFEVALSWIKCVEEYIPIFKLGLEFFLAFGSDGVRRIKNESDADIFLDLKLHDIPQTVGRAVKAIANLNPKFLTVHASGGANMVRSAALAAPAIEITAVTILTSLSEEDVSAIGFRNGALGSAVELAALSTIAGARAIVCSPMEIAAIRARVGESVTIITPGVRLKDGTAIDDQMRSMGPREAIDLGADYLVIGRPITNHWEKGAGAMRERAAEISDSILS